MTDTMRNTTLIDELNNMDKKELICMCNIHHIKKSNKGVSNKYVLRINIFRYEMKRNETKEEDSLICWG